jgi:septal ring factor EnvC (AmiA/AmiB activator)
MALALFSLLLLTPEPPSLLDHLDVLGEDLSRTERELGDLQRQKDILSLEVAQLGSLLAANRIELSRTQKLFQQRIIAISKMQSGARIALLGRTGSLGEFLQTRKLLRVIARHDGRLQDKHTREFQRMSTISTRINQKQGALKETIADIQRQREMLASKRQAKLDFLQEVLSNRPQGK